MDVMDDHMRYVPVRHSVEECLIRSNRECHTGNKLGTPNLGTPHNKLTISCHKVNCTDRIVADTPVQS